jgi:hypothetical protein
VFRQSWIFPSVLRNARLLASLLAQKSITAHDRRHHLGWVRCTGQSCAPGGAYASGDDRRPAHPSRAQEASGTDVHFFVWVIWILITVFIDIFSRHDLPGWAKALLSWNVEPHR